LEFNSKNDLINYIQKNDLNTPLFLGKRVIHVNMTKCLSNILQEYNRHLIFPIIEIHELDGLPNIFKECEEYFYLQRQNKKKLLFWPLSLMDGGNLIQKLKGEKELIVKKNHLAQYVHTRQEGEKYVEHTIDFLFKFLNTDKPIYKKYSDHDVKNICLDTPTTIQSESDLSHVFFLDTLDKRSVYKEIESLCKKNKNEFEKFRQFILLEKTIDYLSQIRSKTKTQKIPIIMVFQYNNDKIIFSLQHVVYWLSTTKSVIST